MGSWLYTLLQKSNNNGWKSSIFQTSAGINSSFIAKSPFLFLRLELLVVYQEGLENAVAKDLHVRLDSMLLVCLCYYFSFHLTVYSFSCNSRPLIFWLLRPIGFLKCVSGITEVRNNFRCWSRVIQICGFMQTFTFFGKFSQSPMVFISWFWVSVGWCLRLFLCKLIQNGCILCQHCAYTNRDATS